MALTLQERFPRLTRALEVPDASAIQEILDLVILVETMMRADVHSVTATVDRESGLHSIADFRDMYGSRIVISEESSLLVTQALDRVNPYVSSDLIYDILHRVAVEGAGSNVRRFTITDTASEPVVGKRALCEIYEIASELV